MAQFIKHVGVNGNQKKVVVVFREVPNDSDSALVIPTDNLPQLYHDDLIRAIESTNCQASLDPSEFLFRQSFHDGTNMLNTIHQRGWMVKVPTKSVVMTPRPGVNINLVDLNRELKQLSNEQAASSGATRSSDIATNAPSQQQPQPEPTRNPPGVIDDVQLAAKFRAQANSFEAEARRLREEAEKLDPKSVVAAVQEKSSPSPATEAKRGRGRPSKKVAA
jgi:hypothetical protein